MARNVVLLALLVPQAFAFNAFPHAFSSLSKAFQRPSDTQAFNPSEHRFEAVSSTEGSSTDNGFNIDTFTFNQANTRRVDDIFSLLADIDLGNTPEEDPRPGDQEEMMPIIDQRMGAVENHDQMRPLGDQVITGTKEDQSDVIPEDRLMFSQPGDVITSNDIDVAAGEGDDLVESVEKNVMLASKGLDGFLKTLQTAKNTYYRKAANRTSSHNSSPSNSSIDTFLDVVLDVPTLEGIRTAGLTSETEAEFLDHLTEVLLGAETRQHSALTLDPVTIIALLTLAAYLIRAVYQILTVTGRSLDVYDFGLALSLSDVPETMSRLQTLLHAPDYDLSVEGRSSQESPLAIPGSIAAILKLQREGHQSCVNTFLCERLQDRPGPVTSPTLADLFAAALSYYYGQKDLAYHLDHSLTSGGSCDALSRSYSSFSSSPPPCSSSTLTEAHTIHHIFTSAASKFLDLWATVYGWLA